MSKKAKGKRRPTPSEAKPGAQPWNVPVSRRDFLKTGVAVGTVAGASVIAVGGKTSLQALQVGQPSAQAPAVDPFAAKSITLRVNGKDHLVTAEPRTMLVDLLRDTMGLIAVKRACNKMSCGACTVLIDGQPFESCTYMALRAVGHTIVTPEIAANDPVVNALQQAYLVADGGQCAYCGPGIIMTAAALLNTNKSPTVADVKQALSGNLCRCGNYPHIIDTVMLAAKNLRGT